MPSTLEQAGRGSVRSSRPVYRGESSADESQRIMPQHEHGTAAHRVNSDATHIHGLVDKPTSGATMTPDDGVLNEIKRPFVGTNLWIPLLLMIAACVAIVYYGYLLASTARMSAMTGARSQADLTSREISRFVKREHERLQAFVDEKRSSIEEILAFPENYPVTEALQTSVKRLFPGAIAFSITNKQGKPLFEDFEGLIGPACHVAMRDYAAALKDNGVADIPPIHPTPDAYHFDLITPWTAEGGEGGLFFVSMSPARIAEIIAAGEEQSGMRVVLVNADDPNLIEVTADGARDVLHDNIRLNEEALTEEHVTVEIPGTHWQLLVIPDSDAIAASVRQVYINVAAWGATLLLVSAILLFAIRRFEQRNSSLFTRSLQASVARQRAILQSMVDGMVTIDESGTIHNVNNAVTALFGYEPNELIGQNVKMLMPEPDTSAHDGYLQQYLTTGESKILGRGRELTARHKSGRQFPVLLTLGESLEGNERMFVGILHDMTAYKEAQRQIVSQAIAIKRTAQELEGISQVASKDLQAPLQRIASLSEAFGAEHAHSLSGYERAQLKHVTDELRDMGELVKGLADYAGTQASDVETVDLDDVLEAVRKDLSMNIQESGASITVQPLTVVRGNSRQLRQVFWNLLDNAMKFRDPSRPPQIDIRMVPAEETLDMEGDQVGMERVTILVRDNGLGIPDDAFDVIFDAFRRLHPRESFPGNGLGLSLCRKIVEGLDGSIRVTSQLGEGSVFHVTFVRASSQH